jgi:hypothetical protein
MASFYWGSFMAAETVVGTQLLGGSGFSIDAALAAMSLETLFLYVD